MIEKICPVHCVPVRGTKCKKEGCTAHLISSVTIYWCNHCNVPSFEKVCTRCGTKGKYIATDLRPVFPEEKLLLAILLKKDTPFAFDKCSVWCASSGCFIKNILGGV